MTGRERERRRGRGKMLHQLEKDIISPYKTKIYFDFVPLTL